MKLFITNKREMDKELHFPELQSEAHKGAFKELRNSIIANNNIPIEIFFCDGIHNYLFELVKCDHKKEVYQYEYVQMIIG